MTPIQKAENALNARIGRLQGNLRETSSEAEQSFLLQAVIVCIGIGEALTDYVRTIGQFARLRHAELKQTQIALTAQHEDLLKTGHELLARFKTTPTDGALRKELEGLQRSMAAIQKTLRRGANALQRDTAPSVAMIDPVAVSIRRLCEADDPEALKRVVKLLVGHLHELYLTHPTLESKQIIDPAAWATSATAQIDGATDFYEACARAGHQALLALEAMTLAVSEAPPRTAAEALSRANASAAARLKTISARFTTP
jgi:hypothetical protein